MNIDCHITMTRLWQRTSFAGIVSRLPLKHSFLSLFFSHTVYPNHGLSIILTPPPLLSPRSATPPFPFRKEQVSHGDILTQNNIISCKKTTLKLSYQGWMRQHSILDFACLFSLYKIIKGVPNAHVEWACTLSSTQGSSHPASKLWDAPRPFWGHLGSVTLLS